ncbi:hypothetical protein, partial [Helicobacter ganmani]|uniref:hypothetical protein n=1 Tax=Helicobacter ganmani TaxID=60246 RepID=UPI003A83678D
TKSKINTKSCIKLQILRGDNTGNKQQKNILARSKDNLRGFKAVQVARKSKYIAQILYNALKFSSRFFYVLSCKPQKHKIKSL